MNNELINQDDHSLYKKNYQNDPFREQNFLYFDEYASSNHIHIAAESPEETPVESPGPEPSPDSMSDKSPPKKPQKEYEHSLKNIIKHAIKFILVSGIFLIIGFLIINGSAYYQIAKNEIQKMTGTKEESPLSEFVQLPEDESTGQSLESGQTEGPTTRFTTKTVLTTSNDPELVKKEIPALDIEVSPIDNRIIIPRIDKNIPVVRVSSENLIKRDWAALEADIQDALRGGVVHYPGTAIPGQEGNVVITGHSSYFPWDSGRFKDVFALLHDVVVGDKIVVYYDQKKYIYEIETVEVVLPKDIQVLEQSDSEKLTLITCTPVGTNLKRLVVTATPIDTQQDSQPAKVSRT